MSLLLSLNSKAYAASRIVYAAALAICFATLIIMGSVAKRRPQAITPTSILFQAALLAAGIGIAVCQPDVRTATMIAFALIVPTSVINITAVSLSLQFSAIIIYAITAKGVIEPSIYSWGLMNLIVFSLAGVLVGHISNKARMKRYVYEDTAQRLESIKTLYESKVVTALKNALRERRLTIPARGLK